jgi:hypothetical protein
MRKGAMPCPANEVIYPSLAYRCGGIAWAQSPLLVAAIQVVPACRVPAHMETNVKAGVATYRFVSVLKMLLRSKQTYKPVCKCKSLKLLYRVGPPGPTNNFSSFIMM